MSPPDFSKHRLLVESDLAEGVAVPVSREQAHYLLAVLRLRAGETVLVFNGRDGEWSAALEPRGKREAMLVPAERTRPQSPASDLHYLFAPLKHARLDYMAQKAVEMGAGVLQPVLTRRTQVSRLNLDRLAANAREAAEQCGILSLPAIRAELPVDKAIAGLEPERLLVFCDEAADQSDPVAALAPWRGRPVAVLIGPEGGFEDAERRLLLARSPVLRLSLGPRILRADTAAVAALALVQAVLGNTLPGR